MLSWNVKFLDPNTHVENPHALIILNQPFSFALLQRLWRSTTWRCCADGGGNRLYDLFANDESRLRYGPCVYLIFLCCSSDLLHTRRYLPDLVKGDLDSLRPEVRDWYASHGVQVVQDCDQDATDLMKCVQALTEKEKAEAKEVRYTAVRLTARPHLI